MYVCACVSETYVSCVYVLRVFVAVLVKALILFDVGVLQSNITPKARVVPGAYTFVCVYACVCVCVRACMSVCVCVYECVCVRV